jgi:dihydroneopterin aldolase
MQQMTVSLHDVHFRAHHGVMPQERVVGNEFAVTLSVTYHVGMSVTDDLKDTISYADLYEIVKSEMQIPAKLLEFVAWKIAEKIRKTYPQVIALTVKLTKLSPPIEGMDGSAGVEYAWQC